MTFIESQPEWLTACIILAVGLVAGVINTMAGGGSLLTLPVLIFLGFDSVTANGTNRLAILVQSFTSVVAFRSKGVSDFRYSLWLSASATVGAVLGAWLAILISDQAFNKVLAVVMLGTALITVFNPFSKGSDLPEIKTPRRIWLGSFAFFFVGVYGGFIQAATGFLMIAALLVINRMKLVKINSIKVFVTFVYTIAAILVFAATGKMDWAYGSVLAISMGIGGWLGSLWSVRFGDVWIRRLMLVMMVVMAIKLLWP